MDWDNIEWFRGTKSNSSIGKNDANAAIDAAVEKLKTSITIQNGEQRAVVLQNQLNALYQSEQFNPTMQQITNAINESLPEAERLWELKDNYLTLQQQKNQQFQRTKQTIDSNKLQELDQAVKQTKDGKKVSSNSANFWNGKLLEALINVAVPQLSEAFNEVETDAVDKLLKNLQEQIGQDYSKVINTEGSKHKTVSYQFFDETFTVHSEQKSDVIISDLGFSIKNYKQARTVHLLNRQASAKALIGQWQLNKVAEIYVWSKFFKPMGLFDGTLPNAKQLISLQAMVGQKGLDNTIAQKASYFVYVDQSKAAEKTPFYVIYIKNAIFSSAAIDSGVLDKFSVTWRPRLPITNRKGTAIKEAFSNLKVGVTINLSNGYLESLARQQKI